MTKKNPSSRLTWVVGSIWIAAGLMVPVIVILIFNANIVPNQAQPDLSSVSTPTVSGTTPPSLAPVPDSHGLPSPTPLLPTGTLIPDPTEIPISIPTNTPTPATFYEGPIIIGYSVGGLPMEVYRFGTGPNAYLIVAGIHGGYEINTVVLADELIAYLEGRPELIPGGATLYILRALNTDGLVFANQNEGRANMNGVDLNRNFPAGWRETWSRDGCWDYLEINAGTHAASEPETIALMAFILEHPIVALVSYHAAAPGFYPAGKPTHPDSDNLAHYLSQASGYPYPAFDPGCQMTGPLVDWVAANSAAALDLELSNHWDTEFDTNLKVVLALLNWYP